MTTDTSPDHGTTEERGTNPPTGPNLLVIGAARSGTTALCASLARHPEVFITDPKEVHFLANANRPIAYRGPGDDVTVNRVTITDPHRYRALFDQASRAGDSRWRGEGSVSTLYQPERSIPAIATHADPDVRLVAILRHPVERAYSSYLYLRSRGFEHVPTFERALDLEERRIAGGYHHLWHLRAMSRYRDQLPPFVDAFGDRLLILVHEEYRRDPAAELARLHRFLDLDPRQPIEPAGDVNRGGVPRSDLLVSVMNGLRRAPMARQLVRTTTPRSVRERIRAANVERPPLDPATAAALATEFQADIAAVEAAIGRTIDDWRRE